MDNSIYQKLTDSAKTEIDKSTQEFIEIILDKAYQNAINKKTAEQEISLSDILEAKEDILFKKINIDIKLTRRKRLALTLSMTGAAYAVFGIVFYLFQSKSFDVEKDLGLIIAALGILISIVTFYYTQLISRRKLVLIKDNSIIQKDNSEFEIVRRWQAIEKLGTEMMLQEGIDDNRARSFNYILNFLSSKLSDKSKHEGLRKLLLVRNQVVHSDIVLSKNEIDDLIRMADEIIDDIEKNKNKNRHNIH